MLNVTGHKIMPKNILQDINPPKKRSIRDIPLKNGEKKSKKSKNRKALSDFSGPVEGIKSAKSISSSRWPWYVGIVVVLLILVITPMIFSSASILITPKQTNLEFDGYFNASDKIDNNIPYTVFTYEDIGSETTQEFTEKEVERKAFGEIIVFNSYNSSSQRLVKNTRFETPDGKIYRIQKSLVVPGRTVDGGEVIPGSVVATVYADEPGDRYNIDLTDFTIPGFKGTDRFSKFYARSKTKMTGGFSGVMKVIDEGMENKMRDDTRAIKEKELKEQIYSKIPENLVLFADGIYTDYESQPNVDMGDSVAVVEKVILKAVLFDKNTFGNYIAQYVMQDEYFGNVEIDNIEDLSFEIDNKENILPWEDSIFGFNLNGIANFVWVFDENKLKTDFAGKTKKETNSILSAYKGITEAEVSISPFWKIRFPKNTDKIKIERLAY